MLHGTVIAKLEVYSFQIDALRLVSNFLSKRKQRVRLNETFSSWRHIEYLVPQGSILGRLFFKYIFVTFYFLDELDIASFADDTALHAVKENKETVINAVETTSQKPFKSFNNNFMKANSDKTHILWSCDELSTLLADGSSIETNTK